MYRSDLSVYSLKIALERISPWKDIWGRCVLLASWVPFEVSLKYISSLFFLMLNYLASVSGLVPLSSAVQLKYSFIISCHS